MPGLGDFPVLEMVEVMDRHRNRLPGWSDAEPFPLMRASDFGANTNVPRCADHLLDGDLEVWKCGGQSPDEWFDPIGAGALAWSKGNILPIRCHCLIDEGWVVLAKSPIERF